MEVQCFISLKVADMVQFFPIHLFSYSYYSKCKETFLSRIGFWVEYLKSTAAVKHWWEMFKVYLSD